MKSPITIIALLQSAFVIVGWVFIAAFIKLHGYPDPNLDWTGLVFIRRFMISLIIVPIAWTGFAAYDLYASEECRFGLRLHVSIGIVLACVIFAIATIGGIGAFAGPHRGPIQAL
ncbi:MAG: hypothetical protein AAF585_04480 [Verrucomicrobiota bacterium]